MRTTLVARERSTVCRLLGGCGTASGTLLLMEVLADGQVEGRCASAVAVCFHKVELDVGYSVLC